jgi:hypothetical protein
MNERDLLDMLPEHFSVLKEMREIAKAEGKQFDKLYDSIDDLLNQVFIVTATWGLDYWERQYLLPVLSEDDDYEKRRRRILTKKRSNKANLVDILRAIEPTIELRWGGLVLPFYILSSTEHYNFGELIRTLEVEKPSHLSYSFDLRPNGYTVKADYNDRYSVALKLLSGTAHAGRYPKANTRGESLHAIIGIGGQRVTGISEYQRSAGLVSGDKDSQSSFGSVDREIIQIKTRGVTGVSSYNQSGQYNTGQILTSSVGSSNDIGLGTKSVAATGYSSFPCGVRFSGEEVA